MAPVIGRNSDLQHNGKVMQRVYKLYNEQKFTDILFEFPNTNYAFTAHRLILAAASPSLLDLFDRTEPSCQSMTITDFDSDTFEQLVVYCYNGQTDITAGNAERMIRGAVTLRLDGVIDVCVDYLMDHLNDFLLRKLISLEADIKCKPLESRIIDYIVANFKKVNKDNEIFGLNAAQWKVIIAKVDANEVTQEDLFSAIVRWYKYNVGVRQQNLPDVIGSLRLDEFETEFIEKQIKPLPGCERLAMEAIKKRGDSISWLAVQNFGEDWLGVKDILRFNQAKEIWEKVTRLEIKRYGFDTAFIENCFVFIGGRSINGPSKDVVSYNLLTKEWTTLSSMQEHRSSVCVVVLNKYIYAISGKNKRGDALTSVERFDWSTGRWQYVANMPRFAEAATVLNGDIYAFGDIDVARYNAATNRWEQRRSMLDRRYSPAVTAHEGFIYVIGGRHSDHRTAERYNPQRNEWTRIASLNVSRRYICAASIGGQLWAFGGVIDPAKWTDDVELYDAAADKWLVKKNLPVTGKFSCHAVPTKFVEKLY
ncbi:PREDICTED: kelch-like protein diablo [Rhagoletis zephyria]|uniref:kelch-like protein diablo n=1 Tax=Rhagoletis zephyria TaxID=28612 RepID=UPI0008118F6B|nr:PREDICTED: kelch-like protein diablo [Rhagoletis zephyria]